MPFPSPSISVIIPTLNEESAIAATLAPLQAWRRAGHEVILADGGSTDGTRTASAGGIDRWLDASRGRARQQNAGAAAARADWLLFLHADTLLPDDALAHLTDAIQGGCHWGRFDVRLSGSRPLYRLIGTLINWRSRLTGIATGDQALFVRRALFEKIGGFPDQPLMEDVEITRRLKRHSRPACLRTQVITDSRRWERKGPWRTILLMWRLRFAYWRGVPAERLARQYYPAHFDGEDE